MRLILVCTLTLLATATAQAAEARRLDGELINLAPGITDTVFVVGTKGATLHADGPATLTGEMTLERLGEGGLTASVVASSLRGVTQDDWRITQTISGTRHDPQVNWADQTCGTAAERKRFGIGGNDRDWDNFSFQWDGWLRVYNNGTDLATSSDDGSRVWIDRNGDGVVSADEWGSNGWGAGQGTTQRTVHSALPAGTYRIRLQFEEGGGGNSCRLMWNDATHGEVVQDPWRIIPVEGLTPAALVTIDGPTTLAGSIRGPGALICGDGVVLGGTLACESIRITGQVTLAADVNLTQTQVTLAATGRLDLAGHHLTVDSLAGDGVIALHNGQLSLPSKPGHAHFMTVILILIY